jgi:hypothetical protein
MLFARAGLIRALGGMMSPRLGEIMKARRSVLNDWVNSQFQGLELMGLLLLIRGFPKLGVLLMLLPILLLLLVGVVALLILIWPWTIVLLWEKGLVLVANPALRVIAVILLAISGFLLYLARTYMRPIYGVAEVFIGMAACWGGLSYPNPSAKALSASLAVVGGIYIIIRGFDNMIDDKSLIDLFTQPKGSGEQAAKVE